MIRTLIQWCYYTFGWFGCTKVSPGCKNCYMFALAKRHHASRNVGPGAPRVLPKYFSAAVASLAAGKFRGPPFTWDRECAKKKIRRGVFPSLCDPFDAEVPIEWFANLMMLISSTPHLDWLLLTKRPQNWRSQVEAISLLGHEARLTSEICHAMKTPKTKPKTPRNRVGSRELVSCLWHLGPNKGWRYWKIMRACAVMPDLALAWAGALESEAMSHEANGVTRYAPHLRSFAAQIRHYHAAFTAND